MNRLRKQIKFSKDELEKPFTDDKMEWLYAIHLTDVNWYKVGITYCLRRRYHAIKHQFSAPEENLIIRGLIPNIDKEEEALAHRLLSDHKVETEFGTEWFYGNNKVEKFVDDYFESPLIYQYKWNAVTKYTQN